MEAAPLYTDVADAPAGGLAYWLTARDGVRIRIGVWGDGDKGTVLLFPGRTEYIEKYGRAASDLKARGFATITVDWRGQGLADRLIKDAASGHVDKFSDYQLDVEAVLGAAEKLNLPRPYYLIGHSMGGAIGLRALFNGLDVNAAMFSAPMWGIGMSPLVRPFAGGLAWLSTKLGFSTAYAPSTSSDCYAATAPFEDNTLTTDRDMFDHMRGQLHKYPELALGGPSLHWLNTSLAEVQALLAHPAIDTPILTWLGTNERIVDTSSVHQRMANWPNGELRMVDGAEHEVLMETPETRERIMDETAAFFAAHNKTAIAS